jgi:hypothetical protein
MAVLGQGEWEYLTEPRIAGGILDPWHKRLVLFSPAPSGTAVNHLELGSSAAGTGVLLGAQGTDADISIRVVPKGTGGLRLITGTLRIDTGNLQFLAPTAKIIPGATSLLITATNGTDVNATFAEAGAVTVHRGTLNAAGPATGLNVTNNAVIGGTLGVTGLATVGSLAVTAGATVGTTLVVGGLGTFNAGIQVNGALADINAGADVAGGLTVSTGNLDVTVGALRFLGAGTQQIELPGGTLEFADGGVARLSLTAAGALTLNPGILTITAGHLAFGAAASRIVPGATSFAVRNTANGADNLLVVDAGDATIRRTLTITGVAATNSLTMTAGHLVVTSGNLTLSAGGITVNKAAAIVIDASADDNVNPFVMRRRATAQVTHNFLIDASGHATLHLNRNNAGAAAVAIASVAGAAGGVIELYDGATTLRTSLGANVTSYFTGASAKLAIGANTATDVLDVTGSIRIIGADNCLRIATGDPGAATVGFATYTGVANAASGATAALTNFGITGGPTGRLITGWIKHYSSLGTRWIPLFT